MENFYFETKNNENNYRKEEEQSHTDIFGNWIQAISTSDACFTTKLSCNASPQVIIKSYVWVLIIDEPGGSAIGGGLNTGMLAGIMGMAAGGLIIGGTAPAIMATVAGGNRPGPVAIPPARLLSCT